MIFKDDNRQIEIEEHLLNRMRKYCQIDKKSKEAGGILVGREVTDTNNLIITHMTEPMPGDQRTRYRFFRKDIGHVNCFQNLYSSSGRLYGYFGEWHTHPEKIPVYSSFDLSEWYKILKRRRDTSPLYFLILGTIAWRFWKVEGIHAKPLLLQENTL